MSDPKSPWGREKVVGAALVWALFGFVAITAALDAGPLDAVVCVVFGVPLVAALIAVALRLRPRLPAAWRRLRPTVLLLALGLFVVYVWPTRWQHFETVYSGTRIPVRVDRFGGRRVQVLTRLGWRPAPEDYLAWQAE